MKCYLSVAQVVEEEKIQVAWINLNCTWPNIGKLLPQNLRLLSIITVCERIFAKH